MEVDQNLWLEQGDAPFDRYFADRIWQASLTFRGELRSGAVPRPCAPPKDGRKEGGRGRDTRQWVNEAKN